MVSLEYYWFLKKHPSHVLVLTLSIRVTRIGCWEVKCINIFSVSCLRDESWCPCFGAQAWCFLLQLVYSLTTPYGLSPLLFSRPALPFMNISPIENGLYEFQRLRCSSSWLPSAPWYLLFCSSFTKGFHPHINCLNHSWNWHEARSIKQARKERAKTRWLIPSSMFGQICNITFGWSYHLFTNETQNTAPITITKNQWANESSILYSFGPVGGQTLSSPVSTWSITLSHDQPSRTVESFRILAEVSPPEGGVLREIGPLRALGLLSPNHDYHSYLHKPFLFQTLESGGKYVHDQNYHNQTKSSWPYVIL